MTSSYSNITISRQLKTRKKELNTISLLTPWVIILSDNWILFHKQIKEFKPLVLNVWQNIFYKLYKEFTAAAEGSVIILCCHKVLSCARSLFVNYEATKHYPYNYEPNLRTRPNPYIISKLKSMIETCFWDRSYFHYYLWNEKVGSCFLLL